VVKNGLINVKDSFAGYLIEQVKIQPAVYIVVELALEEL